METKVTLLVALTALALVSQLLVVPAQATACTDIKMDPTASLEKINLLKDSCSFCCTNLRYESHVWLDGTCICRGKTSRAKEMQ